MRSATGFSMRQPTPLEQLLIALHDVAGNLSVRKWCCREAAQPYALTAQSGVTF